jgi:predicted cupin superfamily sugar epimerase
VTSEKIIQALGLAPLGGEGGYFKQIFKDNLSVDFKGSDNRLMRRAASSSIFYLVTEDQFSALHRLPQFEIFHFYLGSPVEMVQINSDGELKTLILGQNLSQGHQLQVAVKGGTWQGTRVVPGGNWALLGTTVSPAFEDEDMEVASRSKLITSYPHLADTIIQFTRS